MKTPYNIIIQYNRRECTLVCVHQNKYGVIQRKSEYYNKSDVPIFSHDGYKSDMYINY